MSFALNKNGVLPPTTHPNYKLWRNYAEFALDRGQLVGDILESFRPVRGSRILDVGCGEGGTSIVLAERGAQVTAIDFNPQRVEKLKQQAIDLDAEMSIQIGHAQKLDFPNEMFHSVILQDVLEHLQNPQQALNEIQRVLHPDGLLYLSTPNRWSPLNFLCDPHWNLPVVSVLPRKGVAYFITKMIGREKQVRSDFAALHSIFKLRVLLEKTGFTFSFVNREVASQLFAHPKRVVNSNIHLSIVSLLQKLKFEKLLTILVNDKCGFFNTFINPTWYLVAQKRAGVNTQIKNERNPS